MSKKSINAMADALSGVDLRIISVEPSDEALDALMKAALQSAMQKKAVADRAFVKSLEDAITLAVAAA